MILIRCYDKSSIQFNLIQFNFNLMMIFWVLSFLQSHASLAHALFYFFYFNIKVEVVYFGPHTLTIVNIKCSSHCFSSFTVIITKIRHQEQFHTTDTINNKDKC